VKTCKETRVLDEGMVVEIPPELEREIEKAAEQAHLSKEERKIL